MIRGAIPPFNLEEWLQGLRVFSNETEETAYIVFNGSLNDVAYPVFLFNGIGKTVSVCVPSSGEGIWAVNENGLYVHDRTPGANWAGPLIEAAGLTDFEAAGSTMVQLITRDIIGRLDPI